MKELEKSRLKQAREALEEARALLSAGMDPGLVLTSLYYAFYYPVLALLNEGRVPETMQRVTLGLFEQRFITAGTFKKEYGDALRRIFDSKPKCSSDGTLVDRDEVERLLGLAQEFIAEVERVIAHGKHQAPGLAG